MRHWGSSDVSGAAKQQLVGTQSGQLAIKVLFGKLRSPQSMALFCTGRAMAMPWREQQECQPACSASPGGENS